VTVTNEVATSSVLSPPQIYEKVRSPPTPARSMQGGRRLAALGQ
jgi:hypothetical protein